MTSNISWDHFKVLCPSGLIKACAPDVTPLSHHLIGGGCCFVYNVHQMLKVNLKKFEASHLDHILGWNILCYSSLHKQRHSTMYMNSHLHDTKAWNVPVTSKALRGFSKNNFLTKIKTKDCGSTTIYGEILNFIIHMIYERSRTFHNIARHHHHTTSTDRL